MIADVDTDVDTDVADFESIQRQFANHLRSQGQQPAPEHLSEVRLAVYRELFFNNIKGFLDATFPVCAAWLGVQRWEQISRDFFRDHRCTTPYFAKISEEFLHFLEQDFQPQASDPVWFYELAHYEWLELAVDIATVAAPPCDLDGDVVEHIPVAAAACQGFVYQYPVHRIAAGSPSPSPQTTALIVYRDAQEQVRFVETNPLTLGLLALLVQNPDQLTGRQIVKALLDTQGLADSPVALEGGLHMLRQWHQQGVLVGSQA
ncbi:HvfC family RiPP maturation protein [Oceanobacter antarcticus]|uniref:DNA-binding domain-containing protein n=1 Tax=Oceanobacter antarcticus TaxID=3133425 RepID=A0ABW8NGN0_9GAMM